MLTALNVEERLSGSFFGRLFDRLRGNSVSISINSARGVALRQINYINRTGKVEWGKILRLADSGRDAVLCGEDVILPPESGLKRFDNIEFKARLCVNLGLYIESKTGGEIPAAFYDPRGSFSGLFGDVVRGCREVTVITDNLSLYNDVCDKLAQDTGASPCCSENRSLLTGFSLVLAPAPIVNLLPLSGETIVLTSAAPTVCVPGFVYFDYSFRMPNMFDRIKPDNLSEEYFAGALYSRAYQRELGGIVPSSCSNLTSSQTVSSIEKFLLNNQK